MLGLNCHASSASCTCNGLEILTQQKGESAAGGTRCLRVSAGHMCRVLPDAYDLESPEVDPGLGA